jgi:hypothetical protein
LLGRGKSIVFCLWGLSPIVVYALVDIIVCTSVVPSAVLRRIVLPVSVVIDVNGVPSIIVSVDLSAELNSGI